MPERDHRAFFDRKEFSLKSMRYRIVFDADSKYRIHFAIKVELQCDSRWEKLKSTVKNGHFSQCSANIKISTVPIFLKTISTDRAHRKGDFNHRTVNVPVGF